MSDFEVERLLVFGMIAGAALAVVSVWWFMRAENRRRRP
jgi:hypothetical protein